MKIEPAFVELLSPNDEGILAGTYFSSLAVLIDDYLYASVVSLDRDQVPYPENIRDAIFEFLLDKLVDQFHTDQHDLIREAMRAYYNTLPA